MSADVSEYTRGIDQAKQKTTELDDSFEKSSRSLESLGGKMTSIGASLTAAITVPLAGVAAASLKVASDLEMATVAFGTMMQSSERAKAHLDQLRQFALSTPFNFPELVDASKRLQALGFTAGEVIPTMRAIGNAAAALGSGAQGIERISLALGQMQAKGKVSAEEMRQLGEAGIPGWQMLAEALSKVEGKAVSVAEVMKRAELGQISGGVGVDALLKGLEKNFGGLMELQSQTLAGMFSNLKERVIQTFTSIGEALTPLAKSVVTELSGIGDAVNVGIAGFRELPTWVQGSALAFAGLAAAAGPALMGFGTLVKMMGSAGVAVTALEGLLGTGGLAGALTVLAPLAIAVGSALIAWKIGETAMNIAEFVRNLGDVKSAMSGVVDTALTLMGLPALKEIVVAFKVGYEQLSGSFLNSGSFAGAAIPGGAGHFLDLANLVLPLVNADGPEALKGATNVAAMMANRGAAGFAAGEGSHYPGRQGAIASTRDDLEREAKNRDKEIEAKRRASAAAASQISNDEKLLGVVDHDAQLADMRSAYKRLKGSGKYTDDDLADAKDKIDALAKFIAGEMEHVFQKYNDAPKFADKSYDNGMLVRQYERQVEAQKKLKNEILDSYEAADKWADMQRQLALLDDGVVEGVTNEAIVFHDLQKAVMGANAAFMSNADIAARLKQYKADAPSMALTNPELGDFAKENKQVADAMKDLGVRPKPSSKKAQEDYAKIHDAYTTGNRGVSAVNDLEAERAAIQAMVVEQRAAGGAIMAEQASRLHEINKTLAKSMKDTWTSVYNEVNKSFSTLFDGIGKSIVNLDLKPLLDSLKKIGSSIISTTFDTLTKPLVEKLSKGLTDAITGVFAKKAVDAVTDKAVGAGVDAAVGAGAKAAAGKTASKAASTAAGGAMQTIGAIGSAASAVSGIISNFQNAKMETTLNAIEESTRYVKIWTGEQSDSILETLHIIRNRILDFTATYGFSMLVDLTVEMKDMIAGVFENTKGIANLNALLGSVGTVRGENGEMVTTGGGLDVIVTAIELSTSDIVEAIGGLGDAIASATIKASAVETGEGATPPSTPDEVKAQYDNLLSKKSLVEDQIATLTSQNAALHNKGKNETQAEKDQERINRAQISTLKEQLSDLMKQVEAYIKLYGITPETKPTVSTAVDTSTLEGATPAQTATTPPSEPVNVATLPADYQTITAVLTVNQTIIDQTTRLIEAMGGGMGGGAATGGGGEDLEAVVKQMFGDSARVMPNDTVGEMLKGGASQSEIGAFLDNMGSTYEFLPNGGVKYLSEATSAAQSSFSGVAQHASIAATELDSFGGALVTAQQVMSGGILGHAYWNALSEWESGGRKGNAPVTSDYYTDHNEQGLSVIGDLQAQGGFNVPPDLSYWMDNYGRGGTSLDPKKLTSGKNIVITNNTFRSREDLDYLVHLAKAQL